MDDRRILVMIPILFLALLHVGSAAPVFKKASVTEGQRADAILTEEGKVGKTPQPSNKEKALLGAPIPRETTAETSKQDASSPADEPAPTETENHPFAKTLLGLTVGGVTVYYSLWAAGLNPTVTNHVQLWCMVVTNLTFRSMMRSFNFLLGWYYVVPHFIGMTMIDTETLFSPGNIPLKEWLDKYEELYIKTRDALQRKGPHLLNKLCIVIFHTSSISC